MRALSFVKQAWKENKPLVIFEITLLIISTIAGVTLEKGINTVLLAITVFFGLNLLMVILGIVTAITQPESVIEEILGQKAKDNKK